MSEVYNWKRFWAPAGSKINLGLDGFFPDPNSEYEKFINDHVITLDKTHHIPCVILLGEPGIGKSNALESEKIHLTETIQKAGNRLIWEELHAYGSEYDLIKCLFENETIKEWDKDNSTLYMVLDSFDECLLRIETLTDLLIRHFKMLGEDKLKRLYLRIACRTAVWPNSLEKEIRRIWNENNVEIYELMPLRRVDVLEAVYRNNIDSAEFTNALYVYKIIPLAIKPITLKFLINKYKEDKQFLLSKYDLYYEGCKQLCTEDNNHRNETGRIGDLSPNQRMIIAGRIAAILIFANRYAVWSAHDQGKVPDECIMLQEICEGNETIDDNKLIINQKYVKEVLDTGLFSMKGKNTIGFAHQTYAEFLAAWYLLHYKVKPSQIKSLIYLATDSEEKLVPQLYETSAWIARMNTEIFRLIMQTDPEVLLNSDVVGSEDNDRALLTEQLLKLFQEEKFIIRNWSFRYSYSKLKHSNIAIQVKPFITDKRYSEFVRNEAIEIAKNCDLTELQNDLLKVALDKEELCRLRVVATGAIASIGEGVNVALLRPLAMGEAGNDPNDDLKGNAIQAMWPNYLTAEDLFKSLTKPQNKNYIGSYYMFIEHGLIATLHSNDYTAALQWVSRQKALKYDHFNPLRNLVNGIMSNAWSYIDDEKVLDALVEATLARKRLGDSYFLDNMELRLHLEQGLLDEKRMRFLMKIIPCLSGRREEAISLLDVDVPLVFNRDIPWLIEYSQLKEEKVQRTCGHLIDMILGWRNYEYMDIVLSACKNNTVFSEIFNQYIQGIQINSEKAKELKEINNMWKEISTHKENGQKRLTPPPDNTEDLLKRIESGDIKAWQQMNYQFLWDMNDAYKSDLTSSIYWKSAKSEVRNRIIDAAKNYLVKRDPEIDNWINTVRSQPFGPAMTGFRAIRLLNQNDPDYLYKQHPELWAKWSSIILAYHSINEDIDYQKELITTAYHYAPNDIIAHLLRIIDTENLCHNHIFIIHKIGKCFDAEIAKALKSKIFDDNLSVKAFGEILELLINHNVEEINNLAENFITLHIASDSKMRDKAVEAARVLMIHTKDSGFSFLWPIIQHEIHFGKEVLLEVADTNINNLSITTLQRLNEDQLMGLYIWLVQQFPFDEDPKSEEAHMITPRENISRWRDAIIQHLIGMGTPESIQALKRIMQELPELLWLKWSILEAQHNLCRKSWIPPLPKDILNLVKNHNIRFVQSEKQLMELIIESLGELENEIHKTTAVFDLWNDKPYRPKDESRLSDYIKRHLDKDLGRKRGVIANREVQIHGGEKTDIYVNASPLNDKNNEFDTFTVIIEVKGCWHKELNKAMETQLLNQYLKDNYCRHGLYVVGWFNCQEWDENDYKKGNVPDISITEAKQQFSLQAQNLSQNGIRIKAVVLDTAIH